MLETFPFLYTLPPLLYLLFKPHLVGLPLLLDWFLFHRPRPPLKTLPPQSPDLPPLTFPSFVLPDRTTPPFTGWETRDYRGQRGTFPVPPTPAMVGS